MTMVLSFSEIDQILGRIPISRIVGEIADGFVAYSQGRVAVPPVGELIFEEPPGDTHIKYGYIRGDDYFVVKIASGFYENAHLGLPTNSGMMLLFSQKTGIPECVMLDDGLLTQIRTAAAGAVAAQHFAPRRLRRVGVFGPGTQGRLQLEYLGHALGVREAIVCGTNDGELQRYKEDMEAKGFSIEVTMEGEDIAARCNLIVTATPSRTPLLRAGQIRKGTHITALGSDTPEKQELDPAILKMADRVVVDSIPQCLLRGEAFHALQAGLIQRDRIVELGTAIQDPELQRQSDDEITVVDLTGVAVQDIQISKAIWREAGGRVAGQRDALP